MVGQNIEDIDYIVTDGVNSQLEIAYIDRPSITIFILISKIFRFFPFYISVDLKIRMIVK